MIKQTKLYYLKRSSNRIDSFFLYRPNINSVDYNPVSALVWYMDSMPGEYNSILNLLRDCLGLLLPRGCNQLEGLYGYCVDTIGRVILLVEPERYEIFKEMLSKENLSATILATSLLSAKFGSAYSAAQVSFEEFVEKFRAFQGCGLNYDSLNPLKQKYFAEGLESEATHKNKVLLRSFLLDPENGSRNAVRMFGYLSMSSAPAFLPDTLEEFIALLGTLPENPTPEYFKTLDRQKTIELAKQGLYGSRVNKLRSGKVKFS